MGKVAIRSAIRITMIVVERVRITIRMVVRIIMRMVKMVIRMVRVFIIVVRIGIHKTSSWSKLDQDGLQIGQDGH